MHEHGHQPIEQQGYEVTDVHVRIILIAGLCTVALTFVAYVVGTFATKVFRAEPALGGYRPTPVALEEKAQTWNPPVRLQVDPPRANQEFKAEQHAEAANYGVVSEKPEIYRIPVDTAMKIVADKKELPKFPKLATMKPQDTK